MNDLYCVSLFTLPSVFPRWNRLYEQGNSVKVEIINNTLQGRLYSSDIQRVVISRDGGIQIYSDYRSLVKKLKIFNLHIVCFIRDKEFQNVFILFSFIVYLYILS